MHETATGTAPASTDQRDQEAAVTWLEQEFPGWTIQVDSTSGWEGDLRPLWIARSPGHHPQSELTPAKLHTRLADYERREARRRALQN